MDEEKILSNKQFFVVRGAFIVVLSLFLFACADGMVKQDNDVKQIKKTTNYLHVDPDVELDFKSAIALMAQGNNKQAITVLKTVIDREKRLPAPYVNIAIAYNQLGEAQLAQSYLIQALEIDKNHAVANNELGLIYRKQGKFDAARTAYQNAIDAHPEYLAAKRNLGVLCDLYIRDFECALKQFEDYLVLKPDDPDIKIWAAEVRRRL